MLPMSLLALQIVVEATIIAAFGDEQDQVELGPNSCSLADFYKIMDTIFITVKS